MSREDKLTEILASLAKWAYDHLLKQLITPEGGVGVVETVGSGYSVEEDRMVQIERLRMLGMEAVGNPVFAPRDGKTHCNRSSKFIAEGMGYYGLPANTLANDFIAILAIAPGWVEDTIDRAHKAAMRGQLAFVCLEDHPHGHIAAVAPEPMEFSGSWGVEVPLLFNVGRENGLMKASKVYRAASIPSLRAFVREEV